MQLFTRVFNVYKVYCLHSEYNNQEHLKRLNQNLTCFRNNIVMTVIIFRKILIYYMHGVLKGVLNLFVESVKF